MHVGVNLRQFRHARMGGLESYVRHVVQGLVSDQRARGEPVTVFGLRSERDKIAEFTEGAEIVPLDQVGAHVQLRHALSSTRFDFWFCPILVLEPLDVSMPSAVMMPDLTHELYPEGFSEQTLRWRRANYLPSAWRAEVLFTPSRATRDAIIERFGVPSERITVVTLDVDDEFRQRGAQPESEREAQLLLYPATFWPHKNHPVLLEAVQRLRLDGFPHLRLILTGDPSPGGPEMSRVLETLGLDRAVEIHGHVDRSTLVSLYRRATALVYVSRMEGFGLPLLEAFHTNTPVLCGSAGSCPEIAGDAAVLFDESSPESVARAIRRVLTDGALRQELVVRGRARREHFSWARTIETTLAEFGRFRHGAGTGLRSPRSADEFVLSAWRQAVDAMITELAVREAELEDKETCIQDLLARASALGLREPGPVPPPAPPTAPKPERPSDPVALDGPPPARVTAARGIQRLLTQGPGWLRRVTGLRRRARPLRILTFSTHEGYNFELAKTGHLFDVAERPAPGMWPAHWDPRSRPVPSNVQLVGPLETLSPEALARYDLILAQTPEQFELIEFLEKPRLLLLHAAPVPLDQPLLRDRLLGAWNLRRRLRDVPVVYVSVYVERGWSLPGQVIPVAVDLADYAEYPWRGDVPAALTVSHWFRERPESTGALRHAAVVRDDLPHVIVGHNPALAGPGPARSWDELRQHYQRHRLYLDCTPNGGSQASIEAAAAGMPLVKTPRLMGPDHFIDGEAAFIADDPVRLRAAVQRLLADRALAAIMGERARRTAARVWSLESFQASWREVLAEVAARPAILPPRVALAPGRGALAARIEIDGMPAAMPAGSIEWIRVRLRNVGREAWSAYTFRHVGEVRLAYWYGTNGEALRVGMGTALPADVPPGGTAEFDAMVRAPAEPGSYRLRWDLVAEEVAWFRDCQSPTVEVPLRVIPANGDEASA
jgi:glycosyltransferase involved in cell wall biosynthesis